MQAQDILNDVFEDMKSQQLADFKKQARDKILQISNLLSQRALIDEKLDQVRAELKALSLTPIDAAAILGAGGGK